MTTQITGYWTFFCNPAKWEIDMFLATNTEYDSYQVADWQKSYFQPGQLGLIRVGLDNRTKEQLNGRAKLEAGIYAVVEIISSAKLREKKPDKYWREWTDKELKKPIVEIRYLKNLLNFPIRLTTLKSDPTVSTDSYIINGFQASSMPLQKIAFDKVIEIIGAGEQIFENIEPEAVDTLDEIKHLEIKYKNASPQVKEVISRRIERGSISKDVKKLYNYQCKVCEALGEKPYSFKKTNGEHYIETHHIIPVANLTQGTLGISNLITVCANHHRQFHYGNIEIIENSIEYLVLTIDGQTIRTTKQIFPAHHKPNRTE